MPDVIHFTTIYKPGTACPTYPPAFLSLIQGDYKLPDGADQKNYDKLYSEIHAAGYLWALIALKDFFQEPLYMIGVLAENICSWPYVPFSPEPWQMGIPVRPAPEFESLHFHSWGKARRTAECLLSVLNGLLADNGNKDFSGHQEQENQKTCFPLHCKNLMKLRAAILGYASDYEKFML